ncbi:MAG: hypothetical protein SF051_05165 [Elusimicrobiota bacterium]|nr:hypothetical protein [Elusimicrobiota bacterium]
MMKRLLAAVLALLVGVGQASAIVVRAGGVPTAPAGRITAVPRVNGLPGGVAGLQPSGAGLVANLAGGLRAAPSVSVAASGFSAPGALATPAPADAPLLPRAAFSPVAAAPADAPVSRNIAPHDAERALDAAPASEAAPVDAKSQLSAAAGELASAEGSAAASAKAWTLERLFTGARELLGLGTGPAAVSPVALHTAAPASLTPAPAGLAPSAPAASGKARATPPTPLALESRGLNPGERLIAAADSPAYDGKKVSEAIEAYRKQDPDGGEDWIDWTAVKWMFTQRTISTAAFILTSIAYPMVVIPAVGPATFGALMALGPMAAIALGPVNGLIASRMDNPRKGLAYLAWLRAGLAAVLPLLALTGNVTFLPLLLASIANGWQFSLLMTSESAFMAKFAGRNHLPKLTTLGFTSYFILQVALGTLIVIGGYIDAWSPMVPFWISTAVHAALGFLILAKIPDVKVDAATLAKRASAAAANAAKSYADRVKEFAAKAGAFFKKFWVETALFAASIGIYAFGVPLALPVVGVIAAGQPLWMSAALLYWVTRSGPFKKMWANAPIRNAILFSALAAGLFYPFQNLALPLVATALGSKALVYGQLLGAFFFGQLIANAAKASGLPVVRGKPLEFWIRHLVVAMGAAWASLRLFAGDPLTMLAAGVAAAAIGYGLIALTKRLTDRGWIRFLGVGLSGAAGVAVFWGSYPAIFASVMLMGLVLGPFVSAINGYINKTSSSEERAMNFGVSSSLFNAATSVGYALMTLNITAHTVAGASAFPAALWPVVGVFLAAGALFLLAPRWLPGLPDKSLSPAAAKPDAPKK